MRTTLDRRALIVLSIAASGSLAGHAAGQATVSNQVEGQGGTVLAGPGAAADPNDPRVQEFARRQKRRVEIEKELHKLRADYFGTMRNTEIRQAGIAKLRHYNDSALYPSLLKIFAKEKMDVRGAILDMLTDAATDEADATLAWGAVFDPSKEYRDASANRLTKRLHQNRDEVSSRIKSVIAQGLKTGTDDEMNAAAHLAQGLKLYEAIPLLITAQLGGGGTQVATGNGGDNSLAWILVGTQTAYVSDLTPVVGDSAVAFDPTVSVVTEGTVLRVIDAVVVTYRYEIHNALVGLSSEAWGQSTEKLGWDVPKWKQWYGQEFLPAMKAKQDAAAAAPKTDSKDKK